MIRSENRRKRPKFEKFPVKFPVSREFDPETGSPLTGSSYVDGPPWQALFWRFERFGRLRSYVRPLSVRSICPRALMKSDRDPYQPRGLFAADDRGVGPSLPA